MSLRHVTLLVAGLCYGAVFLFVSGASPAVEPVDASGSSASSPQVSRQALPYRAIGLQIQRMDWMDKYRQALDEIADTGADAVKLVVDTRQENGASTRIWLDMRMTPTRDQLVDLIEHARGRGLRVILMPIVLLDNPRGSEWRGRIEPVGAGGRSGWAEWFESYRAMLRHFAEIAQVNGVDVLVIGSELVSSESKLVEWQRTIEMVRGIFKGKITYSANWDHYANIGFWDQLDLIGMNSYWKLDNGQRNRATVEDITSRWRLIQQDLLPFVEKTGKPLLFLEVGWCSMSNAAHEPWDYTTNDPIDLDLQKRLYEGFFASWHGMEHLGGFSIWAWTPGQFGPDDRGYTPQGKPAEQVLRQYLAKPAWPVR
jgi:hypothetical protein